MPYIQPEVLEELKRIDLYTYLKASDPGELVHVSGNVYCTKDVAGCNTGRGMDGCIALFSSDSSGDGGYFVWW